MKSKRSRTSEGERHIVREDPCSSLRFRLCAKPFTQGLHVCHATHGHGVRQPQHGAAAHGEALVAVALHPAPARRRRVRRQLRETAAAVPALIRQVVQHNPQVPPPKRSLLNLLLHRRHNAFLPLLLRRLALHAA
ncbi:uncharacterized protein Tco025E_00127 [Trypanosoma conorhini]|uniref:Uncharacterized protein n=1 Tax=Trypanosoma conorhini TaxID=83891 RepID=A0A422QCN7_9TRYP|nr:uncharacterized protein Tco025E_00127 [Trypanosoma conorhini]RNF27743.1 hypothetical protein Tco025E_00127 [Trypanosoma conorhini]